MTLVDIEAPAEVRRDRWGRYSVVPPDATNPVGYQRATTLAKMLEDTSNLMSWACRMTLLGAANRPDIIASVLAADPDDRQALNRLAEQAKEHGGANIRRDLGTAIHRFVELSHANPTYQVPEPYASDVAAINTAINNAGFDVVPEYSERILVVDTIQVAGMCDLVLRRRSDGRLFIGDLKTGSSVKYGALGWATQLSIYSMADAIYEQGSAGDGSDDRRLPAPDVDRDRAFIIHCEPQSGAADVHALTIGARFVDLAVAVREVRKSKGLLSKFVGGGTDNPVTRLGTANAPAASVVVGPVDGPDPAATPVTDSGDDVSPSPESAIVHEAATAWIINRTDTVIAALSKQHVGQAWPTDVPRPLAIKNGEAVWSDSDLTAIATALDALERRHNLELPLSADPRALATSRAQSEAKAVAAATPPPRLEPAADDGQTATAEQVTALKRIAHEMQTSPDRKVRERFARAVLWQRDAELAGVPWRTGQGDGGATPLRVWAIGMAAIACTQLVDLDSDDPDAAVREVVAGWLGGDAYKHPVGALFGALTLDQAITIGDTADPSNSKGNQQ